MHTCCCDGPGLGLHVVQGETVWTECKTKGQQFENLRRVYSKDTFKRSAQGRCIAWQLVLTVYMEDKNISVGSSVYVYPPPPQTLEVNGPWPPWCQSLTIKISAQNASVQTFPLCECESLNRSWHASHGWVMLPPLPQVVYFIFYGVFVCRDSRLFICHHVHMTTFLFEVFLG